MTAMFDRETKREKILEARHREMRLKERSKSQQDREKEEEKGIEEDDEDLIAKAEEDFYYSIQVDLKERQTKNFDRNKAFEEAKVNIEHDKLPMENAVDNPIFEIDEIKENVESLHDNSTNDIADEK